MSSIFIRRGEGTHGEDGHVKMGAEIGVMIYKPRNGKAAGSHQMVAQARKDCSLEPSERAWPRWNLGFELLAPRISSVPSHPQEIQ